MKYLFTSLAILLFLSSTAFAEEPELPDLYVENLSFSECDESTINNAVRYRYYQQEIINAADDGSYYDITVASPTRLEYTPPIYRTLCYSYSIANKEDTPIWISSFVSDNNGLKQRHGGGHLVQTSLAPGELYSRTGYIRVELNQRSQFDSHCIGVEANFGSYNEKIPDSDPSNNQSFLCFDIEYDFPGKPQNVLATKAEGKILELIWDEVEDADYYEIAAQNVAPSTYEMFYPDNVTSNKAVIEFPNDDLHWITITAIKDGVAGEKSDRFSYGTLIRRFKDVPISSWYFSHLQELQANLIVDGYKKANGDHTGYFGPADNITVAESLKVAMNSLSWKMKTYNRLDEMSDYQKQHITYDFTRIKEIMEGDFELPVHLKNHWASEYIKEGYAMDLTILKNLDNLDPDRPIKRGEIIRMFEEAEEMEVSEYDTYSLNDVGRSSYANFIEYAYQRGFVSGYSDGSFKPYNLLNRAEAVKIINKFFRW